jgi:hypothetical protein
MKQFCGSGFAWDYTVTQLFSSAHTVIADTAIAVRSVARLHASVSGGVPTGGISRARKGGLIIATGSASTASDSRPKPA